MLDKSEKDNFAFVSWHIFRDSRTFYGSFIPDSHSLMFIS